MSLIKKFSYAICACLAGYALFYFCHKQTSGFQITKICSHMDFDPRWEITHSSEEIEQLKKIFESPFYFLGKGGQTYAFYSQEGEFVLKLVKMNNLRQYPLLYRLFFPFPYESLRLKLLLHQKHKLERMFSASLIAYQVLPEESALIALNLNPNPQLKDLTITLVDKLGIAHKISLGNIPFALQKKGERAISKLQSLIEKGDLEEGRNLLKKIVYFLRLRQAKGFGDYDLCIRRNMGVLQDSTPFFIDIGGFMAQKPDSLPSLAQETLSLHDWLASRSPELQGYLQELISSQ